MSNDKTTKAVKAIIYWKSKETTNQPKKTTVSVGVCEFAFTHQFHQHRNLMLITEKTELTKNSTA